MYKYTGMIGMITEQTRLGSVKVTSGVALKAGERNINSRQESCTFAAEITA